MSKKFLSAIIIITLALSVVSVSAADSQKSGIFSYVLNGDTATITGAEDIAGKVTVPETIDGYTVTAIGNGAFGGSKNITEVYIPDTVTSMGTTCFAYSTSIKTVRLSTSVHTVSEGLFYQCEALMGITIPYGVTSVSSKAFAGCNNLVAVTIPNSIQTIAEDAFSGSPNVTLHCYLSDNGVGYTYAQNHNMKTEELITVYVNGKEIVFDQPPVTDPIKFRTLVPLRGVLEEMGAEVEWDNDMQYAGINIGDYRLLVKPYEEFMMVNGKVRYLSSFGIEYNNRILIPIRDVVEAVGGKVSWNEFDKIVNITY